MLVRGREIEQDRSDGSFGGKDSSRICVPSKSERPAYGKAHNTFSSQSSTASRFYLDIGSGAAYMSGRKALQPFDSLYADEFLPAVPFGMGAPVVYANGSALFPSIHMMR